MHAPGVGVLLNPSLNRILARVLDTVDHLAVIPDRFWIDRGVGAADRFVTLPDDAALLSRTAQARSLPLHGIGLSICSAEIFDTEYALELIKWANRYRAPWISEHLALTRVGTGHGSDGGERNAALMLPVPYDTELLDLLIPRVRFFVERLDCPFLLENNVAYVRYPDEDMAEEAFLNFLCREAGCGMLLDLHNLHTNAANHAFDARDYIDRLDLGHVQEIHIAGGVQMMGFNTDSHTGAVAGPVWPLLAYALPRARNLRGVTFEFHESSYDRMGEEGVIGEIVRARATIAEHWKVGDVDVAIPARAG